MSKGQSEKKFGEGSSNLKLLQEIEAISKVLYLEKTYPKSLIPSLSSQYKSFEKPQLSKPKSILKDGKEDPSQKDKRSIWSWRPLKAFSHIRNKRFNCCFSLHVHSIEGLPSNFNDLSLCVHWKRRDTTLMTRPARVFKGNAEFEEQLTYSCSVYGSRNGPQNSAKYEAKHFLLYASIFGNDELDLGKHRIDLTTLLPLTLEELEEENCSGKWTTSFSLSGKAKGAIMNVSFGYLMVENHSNMVKLGGKLGRSESLPFRSHNVSRSLEDIKDLHKVFPVSKVELFDSENMLYLKLEEENLKTSIDYKVELDVKPNSYSFNTAKENVEGEWEVNEHCTVEHVTELPLKEEVKLEEDNELPSPVKEFGSQRDELLVNESNHKEGDLCNKESVKSNYSDVNESVANDFLNMLEIEHSLFSSTSDNEPESPRERLLRQFEKDTLANGYSLFNFDFNEDPTQFGRDDSSIIKAHEEIHKSASTLENLETEALMRKWGLNEKDFEGSPSKSSCGSGTIATLKLPPLGEGLGPFVRTRNGGFLRSMNPSLFSDGKSKGSLIMQASSPVVVPTELGEGIMEILRRLASVGIEKLSRQASKLMPLEDINAKTIQQIAWEAAPNLEESKRHVLSEFVTLEDLAPLAMDKIEVLSIERLRIQSGTSNEDASSNISPQSAGNIGGLKLMDVKDTGDDVDGLMGLSLTLAEWMKFDSGEIDGGDEINERTSKILAAYHASDLMRVRSKEEKRRGNGAKKYGLLGNNLTVALMVQLHDPLRNYEPVGAPMLALVQVERVFVPLKPRIYNKVSEIKEQSNEDEIIPQFKITDVHVAGFKAETGKKKLWGSKTERKCGSRWLLANGMGKSYKHPLLKSKAAAKSYLPK